MERQAAAKVQKTPARANHLQRQPARSAAPTHPLLALQRSIGNQSVQRLLASPYIQTKLHVSTPGDPFEQEADRVADTVMRMPQPRATAQQSPSIQAKPLATQITPLVQRESEQPLEDEQEEGVATTPDVQRVPLAVREDEDDEEKVAPKLDDSLSAPEAEPEKTIATKLATDAPLQRQSREDEDKQGETLQTATLIQRVCTACEAEQQREDEPSGAMVQRQSTPEPVPDDDDVEEEEVQAKAGQSSTGSVTTSVAANIHAMNGGGSPLPDSTRAFFEPRFGADFSGVRVHTDSRAVDTAKSINAKALTFGRNIAFSPGRYTPHTPEGKQLLAHELTHVVQQNGGELQQAQPRQPVAGQAMANSSQTATGVVQRDPEEDGGVLPARPTPGAGTDAEVEAAAPEPQRRPRSEFFYFGTYETGYYVITNDRAFMRHEMTKLIADKGLAPAMHWVSILVLRQGKAYDDTPRPFSAHTIATRRPVRSPLDVEREEGADAIRRAVAPEAIPLTVEVFFEVYGEAVEYLNGFEDRARAITLSILQSSEERANAEIVKYGLTRTEVLPPDWSMDDFGQPERPYSVYSHAMSTAGPSAGLVGAAKDLKAKRDAIDSLKKQRSALRSTSVPLLLIGVYSSHVPEENQAQYNSLTQQIVAVEAEYNVLRSSYERRYPILASYAEDPSAIAAIAQGAGPGTAEILNEKIYETLSNIMKVRREIKPGGRVKIWKLPEIVQLTKVATHATGTSSVERMRSKVVDDKQQQVEDEEFWRNIAIGALALGLALLAAIPTGGSSLVAGVAAVAALGSLGLNVYIASESLQDYNLEKAMAGTDFDRAQAISSEDPSLFWLAVDIAGAALEVGPAVKATRTAMVAARTTFRRLAPLARRALTARGPELAESLAEIRRAAAADDLGEAVVRSIERLRAGADVEQAIGRAAGHEAAARAAVAADSIGHSAATVIGGHTVRVAMPSGALVICSQCTWARAMFGTELAQNAEHLRRLERLEEGARVAAGSNDAAAATRIAEETRQLADELLTLRRTRLSGAARALSAAEIEEFRRLRGLNPAHINQQELEMLQQLREASGEAFQGRLAANTVDHKAERWLEYRSRGGDWPYERWSGNYQQNMLKAKRSHALVDAHRASLGWGETQVVRTPFGPNGPRRILDIAEEVVDPLTGQRRLVRAVEHKEGYITMSDAIRAEIRADRQLVSDGADIVWHIEGRASQGLRDALAGPPPIRLHETRPTMPIAEIRGSSQ